MGLDSLMALSLVNQKQWVLCIACANEAQNPKKWRRTRYVSELKISYPCNLGGFRIGVSQKVPEKIFRDNLQPQPIGRFPGMGVPPNHP